MGPALKSAELVRARGNEASFKLLAAGKVDALAGLRPQLMRFATRLPGSRVLDGNYTSVQQAVATPASKTVEPGTCATSLKTSRHPAS